MSNQQLYVFAGSYAEAQDHGIYMYTFNEQTGQLTRMDQIDGIKNPTFVNVNAEARTLYAIGETVNEAGQKVGEAAAYAFDAADGKLRLINRNITVNAPTCHIQRDAENRYLTVTSYHGGMVGLSRIEEDGSIGPALDVQQHAGNSLHPERQDRPHPHSSFYSHDGRYLLVSDLGLDKVFTYELDRDQEKLVLRQEVSLEPGSGPRHLTFHPDGKFVYVINEINSTVSTFAYDAELGELTALQTISTLPESSSVDNSCAEIAISSDGKYLYGSNRGHDSIVVYAIDSVNGLLEVLQHISVEGGHPRHFALTPNGRYLLAANRDTDNIVTFLVDQASGKLTYTGIQEHVSKPVCVIPVYLTV